MKQPVWPVPENPSLFMSVVHPIEHGFSFPVPAYLLVLLIESLFFASFEGQFLDFCECEFGPSERWSDRIGIFPRICHSVDPNR